MSIIDYNMRSPMDSFFKTAGGIQQLQSNNQQYEANQLAMKQQQQQQQASAQQQERIQSLLPKVQAGDYKAAIELATVSPQLSEAITKAKANMREGQDKATADWIAGYQSAPDKEAYVNQDNQLIDIDDQFRTMAPEQRDMLTKIVGAQVMPEQMFNATFGQTMTPFQSEELDLKRQSLQINRDRLGLDKTKAEAASLEAQSKLDDLKMAAPKLSVNMEKALDSSVALAVESRNSAASMSELASRWREEKPSVGVFGSAKNVWDKMTGSDTALRDLRIRQNQLANSQALKFLPPGPATDKDVSLAREGVPTNMDNPELIARWLEGQSRNELRNAAFNDFRAEWISANGNPGQSKTDTQVNGLDVKKGESFNAAAKRFMAQNEKAVKAASLGTGEKPVDASPSLGEIIQGYEFLGGDPANQSNWRKI